MVRKFRRHTILCYFTLLPFITENCIGLSSLAIGQSVEVVYRNPNFGRVSIDLITDEGDYALHVNPRYYYERFNDINVLVLNSQRVNMSWDQEIRPPGFPFPANRVTTRVSVGIAATSTSFIISANGITITDFLYRGTLTNESVRKVCWRHLSTGDQPAVLESITILY